MFGSNAKKHLSVGRRIGRGLVVVAAAGAALAGACSLAIPDAGAATSALSAPGPTFGCTSSSINVAQVKLNDDVGTVRVTAEVDEWLNGKWTNVAWSPIATVNTNSAFSYLTDPVFNFTTQHGHFFEVFIWNSINGGAWGYYPAQALRDHYTNSICYTS